jgi:membrane protein
MSSRRTRARTLLSGIYTEVRAENVTFMAGSIAYHAFVSLLPLLLLLLTVASLVGDRSIEQAIIAVASAMLSQGAGDVLVSELRSSTGATGVSALGVAVLLWGTLRIFRGLDTAFSDIYETEAANSFLDQILDGLVVLVGVAIAIVAAGYLQDLVVTGMQQVDYVVGGVAAVAGIALAFYPMYYVFPDADLTVPEALPGSVFAGVGLATFESLFGLYLQFSSKSPDANIVTGVVVLLTWLYFSGLIVLTGAVVNAVLGNRSQDVNVVPVFGTNGTTDDGHAVTAASRDTLVEAVEAIDGLFAEHEEVRFGAGGDETTLPAPNHVIKDADASLLSSGRPVKLELQWTPAPDAGADDDGDDGSTDATDDEADADEQDAPSTAQD